MDITTIKISQDTKSRIDKLREYRKETYEEILEKILNILNLCKLNPDKAQSKLNAIQIKNIKRKKHNMKQEREQRKNESI